MFQSVFHVCLSVAQTFPIFCQFLRAEIRQNIAIHVNLLLFDARAHPASASPCDTNRKMA
jgi:hypothetical protein